MRGQLTVDFCDFCTARTAVDRHSPALSDSPLSVVNGLTALVSSAQLQVNTAHLVLNKSKRHAIRITANLDIAYAELGEAVRDVMLKLVVRLRLHEAS